MLEDVASYLSTYLPINLVTPVPTCTFQQSTNLHSSLYSSSSLILTYQQQRDFENIVGKGEIACNKQFLLFPQCFLLNQITVSPFVHIFDVVSLFAAEFEDPKIGISGKRLNTYLYLLTYMTTHLPIYIPTCLHTYLPIHLPTKSTCLHTHLFTYLHICFFRTPA